MTDDYRNDRREGGDRDRGYGSKGGYKGRDDRRSNGNKGYGPKGGKRDYRPRDDSGRGHDDRGDRPRRDYGPRDDSYRPRDRDNRSRDGEYKPRDRDHKPRDGEYKPRDRDDRPRRDFKPRDRDNRSRDGEYRPRDRDDRRRDDRGPRSRDGDRDRRPRDKDDRGRGRYDRDDRRDSPVEEPRQMRIPSDPQKILFRGIDLEVKGKKDQAMTMFLHGAVKLSKGCENNILRMLRDAGYGEFAEIRKRMSETCPEDALIIYDYLCITLVGSYDRTVIEEACKAGNPIAIYCKIRLNELDGEDPLVDTFYSAVNLNEAMIEDGLKLLIRKKSSAKATAHLQQLNDRKRLRETVNPTFVKAMKGDDRAISKLVTLADTFPEAEFLSGYVEADREGYQEQYLRENMPVFEDTILSMVSELGITETAYGKFLKAKKMQRNDEDWVQSMIGAVKAGSEDAMEELRPIQDRKDVKKSLSTIYLDAGDAAGLVRCFDGEDTYFLNQYCSGKTERYIEVARLLGGTREIEWLKRGFRDGHEGCRDAVLEIALDESRRCKQLVYVLHDVGADMEAAKMYFAMGDDPSLPAVKWLGKVCSDDEVKEYVRGVFEAKGDMETFESLFVDDGYQKKHTGGGRGGPKRSGGFNRNRGGNGRY